MIFMQNLTIELRPQNFSQVIGNKEIVAALQSQIESGNIPTAFLFSGASGTGKTTLAGIVAKAVQGKDFDGEPEVLNINAADTRGIDDIRELVSRINYVPMVGKYRIIILNEAQQLTDAAQNVLLDPMEKKNSPTIFIITTTDPQKLIPALKNRCMSFNLKGLDSDEIQFLVNKVLLKLESFETSDKILDAIDSVGMTAPRDIIRSIELYASGLPADECVQNTGADPELQSVVKSVMSGKWTSASQALMKVKASDANALRTMIASSMRFKLLKEGGDTPASCLKELALYSSPNSGCDLGALTGIIWNYCRKMSG
jgi:DNA polymerase III delta prime subunit